MAASQSGFVVGRRGGWVLGLKGKQPRMVFRVVVLWVRVRDGGFGGWEGGAMVSGVEVTASAMFRLRKRVICMMYHGSKTDLEVPPQRLLM